MSVTQGSGVGVGSEPGQPSARPPAPAATAPSFPRALLSLPRADQLVAGGAAAFIVLAFLPSYRVSLMGMSESLSLFGVWYGKVAVLLSAAAGVAVVRPDLVRGAVDKLPAALRDYRFLALTGLAFLVGPIAFLFDSGEVPAATAEQAERLGGSIGRTFFFWLALLASGTSLGGAALKKLA